LLSIQKVGNKLIIDLGRFSNPDAFEDKVKELIRQEPKISPAPSISQDDSGKINTEVSPDNR